MKGLPTKIWIFGVLVFLLCLVGQSDGSVENRCFPSGYRPEMHDRRIEQGRLRVGTFNVEWLVLDNSGRNRETKEVRNNHIYNIAGVLRNLNLDVVVLTEVQSCEALRILHQDMNVRELGYEGYLIESSFNQNVAMLTKVTPDSTYTRLINSGISGPVPGSSCGKGFPEFTGVFSRYFYTTIRPENFPPMLLVGAHLITGACNVNNCRRREAQANLLQRIVHDYRGDKEVIVLGDFNDYDFEVPDVQRRLYCIEKNVSNPTNSRVLDILKNFGNDERGMNIAKIAAQDVRFTAQNSQWTPTCSSKRISSIDHIIVSPKLYEMLDRDENPFKHKFPDPCGQSRDSPYSDHWPVVITLYNSSVSTK